MSLPERITPPSRRIVLKALGATAAGIVGGVGTATAQDDGQSAETTVVAQFDPPQLPENIAVDGDGMHYLSMAPTGEIWRLDPEADEVSPESAVSLPQGMEGQFLLGIVADAEGSALLACNNTGNEETHGVWHVPLDDGDPEMIAPVDPAESTLNGIAADPAGKSSYLVTDHTLGAIWRVSEAGCVQQWLQDPLLEPNPYAQIPVGVDGIGIGPDGDVWVDNLSFGAILRIPVESDGSAGTPEVFAHDDALVGSDGLTVDSSGNVYVAVNARNEIARVTPDAQIESVASGDAFDFPADVHFGPSDESTLYVANFALLTAQAEDQQANPSYVSVDLGQ